jgi:ring-1,2-phenylacetyl-CoA epoxidase subunit PaaD
MRQPSIGDREAAEAAVASVTDPEIPVLTIEDLGIVRRVEVTDNGVEVDITPTYSGCPAMDRIRQDLVDALGAAGFDHVEVRTVYAPAWTTDWMSEPGKRKLAEYGIAPPGPLDSPSRSVLCPRCASGETREVSEFGSTACKALMACTACGEPFDRFKEL